MKSTLTKLASLSSFPLEVQLIDNVEKEMKNQTENLLKKFRKTLSISGPIEKGDIVVLQSESANPKFNRKKLPLNVSAGLLDKDFEEQLIGLSQNDTKVISLADIEATIKVLDIRRNMLPELTDEIVEEAMKRPEYNEPDIKTIDQYYAALKIDVIDMLKEMRVSQLCNEALDYLMKNSEYTIDQNELDDYFKSVIAEAKEEFAKEGKSLETLTAEEYNLSFGMDVNSYQDYEQLAKQMLSQSIFVELFYYFNENKSHQQVSYNDFSGQGWQQIYQYIKNNVEFEVR